MTALHKAALHDSLEVAILLIDNGAKVEARDQVLLETSLAEILLLSFCRVDGHLCIMLLGMMRSMSRLTLW